METLGEDASKQLSPLKVNHEFLFQYYNKTEIVGVVLGLLQSAVPVEQQKITSQGMLVTTVKQYVLTHYNEDLTVKCLADLFNTNYSHLSTIFKKEETVSLGNYIKKVRMEEAQRLLVGTGNSITTIAEVVGFQDVQYFYKVFKAYTGQTPLNYRNQKVQ